jgi:hypothetical protein
MVLLNLSNFFVIAHFKENHACLLIEHFTMNRHLNVFEDKKLRFMTITFIVTSTHCKYVVPNNLRKFKYVCFLQFYWLDFTLFAIQIKN